MPAVQRPSLPLANLASCSKPGLSLDQGHGRNASASPDVHQSSDKMYASKSAVFLNGKAPLPPHHRRKAKIKKRKPAVLANLALTKYSVVRQTCVEAGMTIADTDSDECMFIWSDAAVPIDRITDLKSYQKINHFPAMGEICRKDSLARNMSKIQKEHPDEYNFVPHTWIFPGEYNAFQCYCRDLKKRKKHKTFIVKPSNGAMGNGRLSEASRKDIGRMIVVCHWDDTLHIKSADPRDFKAVTREIAQSYGIKYTFSSYLTEGRSYHDVLHECLFPDILP